ncbi:OsmC family protein [Cryobacterium sp. SO2]|uniref:OsmC family protein n=1 Tax=Cryobacterium sp. SO2 TaxID=1897060 RepID=UPI00223DC526|nr:OsmC family protein [Cryobacterium sp. SO2]WEO78363.1 OsmC family protein [Cryobacterium sp. SO2]
MIGAHHYAVQIQWTGNRGTGTSSYRAYGREHTLSSPGKEQILGSADRAFHGNADRWNPEELLLAALSQCHLLSYLHVAVNHGVVVLAYADDAIGTMAQTADGGGHFTAATLRPRVTIADPAQVELAQSLHAEAAKACFIAASVNFPVGHEPIVIVAEPATLL